MRPRCLRESETEDQNCRHGKRRDHKRGRADREGRPAEIVAQQRIDRALHRQHRTGQQREREPTETRERQRARAARLSEHDQRGAGQNDKRPERRADSETMTGDAEQPQ